MLQQVNLYPEELKPQVDYLSASRILIYIGTLFVVLTSITLWSYWEVSQTKFALQREEMRKQNAVLALEQFYSSQVRPTLDLSLEQQISYGEETLQTTERIISILQKNDIGYQYGYSKFLDGLARRHVKGIWLKKIVISNGGERILLGGEAMKPKVLPEYLDQLKYEEAFIGRRFNLLEFNRKSINSQTIDFTLATRKDDIATNLKSALLERN